MRRITCLHHDAPGPVSMRHKTSSSDPSNSTLKPSAHQEEVCKGRGLFRQRYLTPHMMRVMRKVTEVLLLVVGHDDLVLHLRGVLPRSRWT
jgi:hypothetical protein